MGAPPAARFGGYADGIAHKQLANEYHNKYTFYAGWFCNDLEIQYVVKEYIQTYCTSFTESCGTGSSNKGIDVTCIAYGAAAAGAIVFATVSVNGGAAVNVQVTADSSGVARISSGCNPDPFTAEIKIVDVYFEGAEWSGEPCLGVTL